MPTFPSDGPTRPSASAFLSIPLVRPRTALKPLLGTSCSCSVFVVGVAPLYPSLFSPGCGACWVGQTGAIP